LVTNGLRQPTPDGKHCSNIRRAGSSRVKRELTYGGTY
jgi:hypothetical protein